MPALACCVDAAHAPPGYAFPAGDSSLPFPVPCLPGVPLSTTSIHAAAAAASENSSGHWSPSLSAELYKIDGWGAPYFSVNSSGNVSARPLRLESLQSAFDFAIQSQAYEAHYQGVYPVKCNQDRREREFGLTTTQILRVVKKLEQAGMLDCFQLLHFHIGSQIPSTALLSDGASEAAQIYCELVRLGARMQVIDIGGGLVLSFPAYWMLHYRNLTASAIRGEHEACVLYADQLKQSCVDQFKEGNIGMEQLAAVDALCELFYKTFGASDPVRTYHVNLSLFTSIPDFWGIGQLFPIVPIHRLDQRPSARGILSDLTCDSDGKIDKFIGGESSLPLHEIEGGGAGGNGGKYYLGMFLGGAYEEALGGIHNLFGGPSVYEPELMFETLKHRVEEYCHHDEDSDDSDGDHRMGSIATVANCLASYFHNMPYLVAPCSATGMNNSDFYYCNDDDYNAAADTCAGEDEK
uniref:Arginine decarboxylase n=1 Tax=Salix viminalis TaxID=40686 RepID=A0A6N2MQX8_SALVM